MDLILEGLKNVGLTTTMSGMDNVRNLTSSPIAGVDPHELMDVRPLVVELQNMITNYVSGVPTAGVCNCATLLLPAVHARWL